MIQYDLTNSNVPVELNRVAHTAGKAACRGWHANRGWSARAALATTLLFLAVRSVSAVETRLNFPEQQFDPAVWKLVGANADVHVRPGEDSVAISIGPEDTTQSVGFGPAAPLKGDFEIRAEYEIELLNKPATGFGCGPTIYLTTRSESKNTATIGRLDRTKEGESFTAYWAETIDGERKHHPQLRPAAGKKGVLSLKRAGETLTYFIGETWDGPMQSIRTVEFGDDDVNYVRIGVDRGGDKQPVRVRWRKVQIVSGVNDIPTEQKSPSPARIHASGNQIILSVLLGVALGIVAIWWFSRGRHLS